MATLGERLRGKVSDNGVGRRGPFPEGRFSFRFENAAPPGKVRAGAFALPKAGVGIWIREEQASISA
ncbi:MAG: hypothetical protein DRJ61_05560 [Acidobacteria bacterium]|nr:MAG: hypothetical protein DRJ65_02745 [Acidobacteriota bacterium]RLE34266.1 MAG: hypothetical protein DRJ61_05560 [Acidobacteriota bacterium]